MKLVKNIFLTYCRELGMWPMMQAVVFVASVIADFPALPPKDFKF